MTSAEYGPGTLTTATTIYSINFAPSPTVGTGLAILGWAGDIVGKKVSKWLKGKDP